MRINNILSPFPFFTVRNRNPTSNNNSNNNLTFIYHENAASYWISGTRLKCSKSRVRGRPERPATWPTKSISLSVILRTVVASGYSLLMTRLANIICLICFEQQGILFYIVSVEKQREKLFYRTLCFVYYALISFNYLILFCYRILVLHILVRLSQLLWRAHLRVLCRRINLNFNIVWPIFITLFLSNKWSNSR